jgi:hypothetical protein
LRRDAGGWVAGWGPLWASSSSYPFVSQTPLEGTIRSGGVQDTHKGPPISPTSARVPTPWRVPRRIFVPLPSFPVLVVKIHQNRVAAFGRQYSLIKRTGRTSPYIGVLPVLALLRGSSSYACSTASRSISMVTSSLTSTPPDSRAWFQLRPKSLRLILVLAVKPATTLP